MLKDKKLSKKMATIYHWVYKSVEYMTIKHKRMGGRIRKCTVIKLQLHIKWHVI